MSQPPHDVGARRASPLAALQRVWPLALVITLVGLVLGVGYAASHAVTYSAESRVAVGTGSLSASAVAGYTVGVDSVAADYARSVTSDDAIARLRKTFGAAADGVLAVNASPLPSSAVIRVDVDATSSDVAVRAATAVTASFVADINRQVASKSPTSALNGYQAAQTKLLAAQTTQTTDRAALDALRNQGVTTGTQLTTAQTTANADAIAVATLAAQANALNLRYQSLVASPAAENGLRNVQSAALIGSDRRSLLERYALLGLVLGVLLALAAAAWLDRRRVARSRGAGATELGGAPTAALLASRTDSPPAGPGIRGLLVRMMPTPAAPATLPTEQPTRALPAGGPTLAGDPYLREALRAALEQQTRQQAADLGREIERRRRSERDAARTVVAEREIEVDEPIEDLLPWPEPDLIPGSERAADRERRRAEKEAARDGAGAFFGPPHLEVEELPTHTPFLVAAPDPAPVETDAAEPSAARPGQGAELLSVRVVTGAPSDAASASSWAPVRAVPEAVADRPDSGDATPAPDEAPPPREPDPEREPVAETESASASESESAPAPAPAVTEPGAAELAGPDVQDEIGAAAVDTGPPEAERGDELGGELEPRLSWPRRHGLQPRKVS